MSITLYDIPSTTQKESWSPNTLKARTVLNFKGLDYKTEWVEYPDIERVCKQINAKPTGLRGGNPLYTLPVIHDASTGETISDSLEIVLYLDKTYPAPTYPVAIPSGTAVFHAAFNQAFTAQLGATAKILFPLTCLKLSPESAEHFRSNREAMVGKFAELLSESPEQREAHWATIYAGWDVIDSWFSIVDKGTKYTYVMGETPVYADLAILSRLTWFKVVFGEDSKEWKALAARNNGRWGQLVKNLDKYNVVQ